MEGISFSFAQNNMQHTTNIYLSWKIRQHYYFGMNVHFFLNMGNISSLSVADTKISTETLLLYYILPHMSNPKGRMILTSL